MKEHVIIGKDRSVSVPNSLKKIGIQYDHNVNTITFDCPRYPDEDSSIDMARMQIFLNYMLPDKTMDCSIMENVVVDETDPTIMHFDWVVKRNHTRVNGVLSTLICIKDTDTEGNEIYHWNTDLFQSFSVGNGMECSEQIVDMNPDVITQLLVRMGEVDNRTSTEAMQGYVNTYMEKNPVEASQEQVNQSVNTYFAENPPSPSDQQVSNSVNAYMNQNPPQPTDEQASAGISAYMNQNPPTPTDEQASTAINAYMTEHAQSCIDDYLTEHPVTPTEEQMKNGVAANSELLQSSVDDYLGRNPLQLDEGLTESTKAAPADKVGEIQSDIDVLKGDLDDLRIESKNMFFVEQGEIVNGIITVNAEKSGSVLNFKQNGQNTSNVYAVIKRLELEAGKTYTFSATRKSGYYNDSGAISLAIYRTDNNAMAASFSFWEILNGSSNSFTFTPDYSSYYIQVVFASTGTIKEYDCDINFNLVEGAIADYSEYGYVNINKELPTIKYLLKHNIYDIVVAKDGSGDYTNLTEAVEKAKDFSTIYVKNGVYDNEIIKAWLKTVFIIGESREGVVIKNNTGAYATPPIEMGTGLLCNLTIYAENDGSLSSEPSSKGYALHSESSVTNYHKFVIENCTLKSDWRSSWGMGMRANMEYIIRNTDFESVYFHDSEHSNSVGLQKIFFDMCNITNGLILQDQNMTGSTIDVRFNRCLVKSLTDSDITYYLWDAENTTVIVKNSLDDFPNWSLNNYSWGNNKAEFNAIN